MHVSLTTISMTMSKNKNTDEVDDEPKHRNDKQPFMFNVGWVERPLKFEKKLMNDRFLGTSIPYTLK